MSAPGFFQGANCAKGGDAWNGREMRALLGLAAVRAGGIDLGAFELSTCLGTMRSVWWGGIRGTTAFPGLELRCFSWCEGGDRPNRYVRLGEETGKCRPTHD